MAANGHGATIELGLEVTGPDGARRDLRIVAEGDAPARQLFAALAAEIGAPATTATRRGEELPPDAPVSELALRHGDEIRFGEAEPEDPRGTVDLVVLGGPDSGRRVPLESGTHRVGRSAEVALDDPALSSEHLVLTIAADGTATVADSAPATGRSSKASSLAAGEERELRAGEVVQAGRTLLGVAAPDARLPDAPLTTRRSAFASTGRHACSARSRRRCARSRHRPTEPHRARLPSRRLADPARARGRRSTSGTTLPTMLLFALLSPVMAVSTYIEDRRSGRKGFERTRRGYREQLVALRDELGGERASEAPAVARRSRRPSSCSGAPARLEPTLWERRLDDRTSSSSGSAAPSSGRCSRVRARPRRQRGAAARGRRLAAWYATVPAVAGHGGRSASSASAGLCGPGRAGRRRSPAGSSHRRPRCTRRASSRSPRRSIHRRVERVGLAQVAAARRRRDSPTRGGSSTDAGRRAARARGVGRARRGPAARGAEAAFGAAAQARSPALLLVVDEDVAPERPLVAEVLGRRRRARRRRALARPRAPRPPGRVHGRSSSSTRVGRG